MAKMQTATCQDCGWQGPVEQTKELRNVWDRVQPGDVMPAGECPEEGCGGAAMLDHDDRATDDLRPAMVALMLGLDRLHEGLRTGALHAPVGAHLKELADYRAQGTRNRSAAATRLQYLRRDRRPGGRVGVLGYPTPAARTSAAPRSTGSPRRTT